VISAGFRNEPICRRIQKQSAERTRLVHIGRPWASLDDFDLVVTTPQYRLPEQPNVLQNHTTLHRISARVLDEASRLWAPRLAELPRPLIAVVVGGNSGPYTLGAVAAARLGREASALAQRQGGCLLVTTSARTSPQAVRALEETITAPARIFRWTPDAGENPYLGFLAAAESIIVTGDSISMLSEACATGKPVYIFDLGTGDQSMRAPDLSPGVDGNDFRPGATIYRLAMSLAPKRLTRDLRLVHRWLVDQGHAAWLGTPFPGQAPTPPQDLAQAVRRVRALFQESGAR